MIKHKGDIKHALEELKNNKNNAVAHIYDNLIFKDGILKGATVTIKDLFATSDAPTQASSKILHQFEPSYDATIVQKIKEQGAAIVAKTHLDELALGGTGQYSAYGLITNPIDKTRIIGGSSSGSAATFTNNISIAIGSDTGDSVRLPASYIGSVGFKPSYGAVSRYGMFAYASSLDTVGWFTHNVHDVILTAQALYGVDSKDMTSKKVDLPEIQQVKPQKIAFLKDVNNLLGAELTAKINHLKTKLEAENIEVKDVTIDQKLLDAIDITYQIISFSEASSNDANLNGVAFGQRIKGNNWEEIILNSRSQGFGAMVQRRFTLGAFFLSAKHQEKFFLKAQKVRRLIVEAFNRIYEEFDLLIFPAAPIAPKLDALRTNNFWHSYLVHANFAGSPSLSLPFTKIDNMPINLAIDTKIYDDKKLLSHALYLEDIIGGLYE